MSRRRPNPVRREPVSPRRRSDHVSRAQNRGRPLLRRCSGPFAFHTACPSAAFFVAVALAQTTQPRKLDPDRLLEQVAARPLVKLQLQSAQGKPLTKEQAADLDRADQLLTDAEAARGKGDFAAAASAARSAAEIRGPILGFRHFIVVSADVLANNMTDWSKLPPSAREEIAEADRKHRQAREHYDKGQYALAADNAGAALKSFESLAPAGAAPIAAALLELGRAQIELSQLDAAEAALTRAQTLVERAYGPQHPQVALVLDRIGWLRFNQARRGTGDTRALMDAAAAALSKATELLFATVGETGDFAEALDNRGTVLLYSQKPGEALGAKFRALVVRRELFGPDHEDVGVSLSNIALIYESQGAFDRAVTHRRDAARILEKALGADHPYALLEKSNLVRLLLAAGETDAAIPLLDELAGVNERQSAEPTPDLLSRTAHLCGAYLAAGKIEKALTVLDRALEQAKVLYEQGQKQPALLSLIDLFRAADNYRLLLPARRVLAQVVAWDDAAGKSSGGDNVERILRVAQLGELNLHLGNNDDARKLLEQAVSRLEALKGGRAVELVAPLTYLSELLETTGDLEGAERACDKALQVAESTWGREAPGATRLMVQLAGIITRQGRHELAEILLDEAAEVYERLDKTDPVAQIRLRRAQARLLVARGMEDEAVERLKEALEWARGRERFGPKPKSAAMIAEILHDLLSAGDSDRGPAAKDGQAWRTELKTLLGQLKDAHAITAEEEGWLRKLGDDTR